MTPERKIADKVLEILDLTEERKAFFVAEAAARGCTPNQLIAAAIAEAAVDLLAEAEGLANARLIAAAPELLAACMSAQLALRATSQRDKDYSGELTILKAAIAKAEGR